MPGRTVSQFQDQSGRMGGAGPGEMGLGGAGLGGMGLGRTGLLGYSGLSGMGRLGLFGSGGTGLSGRSDLPGIGGTGLLDRTGLSGTGHPSLSGSKITSLSGIRRLDIAYMELAPLSRMPKSFSQSDQSLLFSGGGRMGVISWELNHSSEL